jgi:hypothetical protein
MKKKNEVRKRKRITNQKECEHDLRDDLPLFREAFQKAKETFDEKTEGIDPNLTARAFSANSFNTYVSNHLKEVYGPRIRRGKGGRIILHLKDYIILIKKLDSKGYPMNSKSIRDDAIRNQEQGNLFGDEYDGTKPILYLGYQRDKLKQFCNLQIVYLDECKKMFAIDISEERQILVEPSFNFAPIREATVALRKEAKKKGTNN